MKSHGLSGTSIHSIYNNMKRRVFDKTNSRYKDYGGRGVTICNDWLGKNGLSNFYEWALKNGYEEGLSIDRINVDGNYEPSNCRWLTMEEQANNKRNTLWVTIDGETKTLQDWSRQTGVKSGTLWFRLQSGYEGKDLIKSTETQSGERYIYWDERKQRWRVRIKIGDIRKSFGTYSTLQEAINKRDSILNDLYKSNDVLI